MGHGIVVFKKQPHRLAGRGVNLLPVIFHPRRHGSNDMKWGAVFPKFRTQALRQLFRQPACRRLAKRQGLKAGLANALIDRQILQVTQKILRQAVHLIRWPSFRRHPVESRDCLFRILATLQPHGQLLETRAGYGGGIRPARKKTKRLRQSVLEAGIHRVRCGLHGNGKRLRG